MEESAMKKTLSMLLVLALTLCLTTAAFAMSGDARITGMIQGLGLGYSSGSGGSADLGDVYPQDERVEYITLYDSMFSWDSELTDSAAPAKLTASQIRSAQLDVRSTKQNSKVIDSITLNSRESRIEVKFKKEYIGTKEIDFDFDVYLTIDGRRQSDYAMNFSGTFGNQVIELYSDYGSVDISDGCVAEAQEYISKLEVDIGNGVTITTRISKDKRVYGTATLTPDSGDDEVMREYKDISDVLTLRTVGLNGAGSTVRLGAEYRGCYVYGKDLEYLGKGGDELPYADKYYLSSIKLDIPDDESESEFSKAPVESDNEPSTPSTTDQFPPNVNHNPSTGR